MDLQSLEIQTEPVSTHIPIPTTASAKLRWVSLMERAKVLNKKIKPNKFARIKIEEMMNEFEKMLIAEENKLAQRKLSA